MSKKLEVGIDGIRNGKKNFSFSITIQVQDNYVKPVGDVKKNNVSMKQFVLNNYPTIFTEKNIEDFEVRSYTLRD